MSLAAATLGYIYGDIPGAALSYSLYNRMKRKATTTRKRKHVKRVKYRHVRPAKRKVKSVAGRRYSRRNQYAKKGVQKFQGSDLHSGTAECVVFMKVAPFPRKIVSRHQARLHYKWDYVFDSKGPAGAQNALEMLYIGTTYQWLISTGSGYSQAQSALRWLDVNPNANFTGSNKFSNSTSTVDKLLLHTVEIDSYWASMENIAQEVVIYFLVCKRDTNHSPTFHWNTGLTDEGLQVGIISQPAPGNQVGGNVGFENNTLSHSVPRGKLFHYHWKVGKVCKFRLAPAANYNTKAFITMNQLCNIELYGELHSSGIFYPKGCVCMLVTINGAVVRDKTNANDVVTFGSTQVAVVHKVHNHFKVVQHNAERVDAEIDVTQIPYNTDVGNQYIVSYGDTPSHIQQVG